MTQPAIPARCGHLATLPGGMPVPYVALQGHDGAPVLGALDANRVERCIRQGRCQVCGQRLALPYVVLVRESDAAARYSSEPAVHPECAAYAVKACPMLNGRQDRYVTTAGRVQRAGWTVTDPAAGRTVEPWSAVWLGEWYAVTFDEGGQGVRAEVGRAAAGAAGGAVSPGQPRPGGPPAPTGPAGPRPR